MNFLTNVFSSMPLLWWVALIISALGIAAICLRVLESDGVRAKRAERNKKKELRSLAERISSYGQGIHQRYPSGDVIVSERDLAEELRKRPLVDGLRACPHFRLAGMGAGEEPRDLLG